MSVHLHPTHKRPGTDQSGDDGTGIVNGGGPPYDGSMENRVAKLEEFVVDARERLTKIETRLDHTATKSDVQESANKIIIWVAGTAVTLGVAAIVVMTFVLNNAVPKAASTPPVQPQPIVIYAQPAPTAAAPSHPAINP